MEGVKNVSWDPTFEEKWIALLILFTHKKIKMKNQVNSDLTGSSFVWQKVSLKWRAKLYWPCVTPYYFDGGWYINSSKKKPYRWGLEYTNYAKV